MKLAKIALSLILLAGMFSVASCKKKGADAGPPVAPMQVEGVNVDLPKLQASIDASGNADLQSAVRQVLIGFRYHTYEKALMDMDKLANDPGLNEEQKKLAAEVLEQVKQVAQKAPPADAPPAQ